MTINYHKTLQIKFYNQYLPQISGPVPRSAVPSILVASHKQPPCVFSLIGWKATCWQWHWKETLIILTFKFHINKYKFFKKLFQVEICCKFFGYLIWCILICVFINNQVISAVDSEIAKKSKQFKEELMGENTEICL